MKDVCVGQNMGIGQWYCRAFYLGLTLLEVLIAVGIIGILGAAAVVTWRPNEVKQQGNDARRIADLTRLYLAVTNASIENPAGFMGATSTVYLSLPDTSFTCDSFNLPALPVGWQYHCAIESDYRKSTGAGWLPVGLANYSSVANLDADPVNNDSYYYAYVYFPAQKQWVLTAMFQSEKYLKQHARTDGGIDDARFEIGSNLQLWAMVLGLAGYWELDGISNGITGDLLEAHPGGVTGAVLVPGKVGNALQFDGNDFVQFDNLEVDTASGHFNSVEFWANWNGQDDEIVFGWDTSYALSFNYGCFGFNVGSGNLLGVSSAGLANQWVNAVVVFYNGVPAVENSKIYLNGVEQIITSCHGSGMTSKDVTPTAFVADWGTGGGNNFTGIIDQLKIYSRALSDSEVAALYWATR